MSPFSLFNRFYEFIVLILFLLSSTACMFPSEDSSLRLASVVRNLPTFIGPKEMPFCSDPKKYYPSVTISGRAKYEAREIYRVEGSLRGGLGRPGDPKPIRYAEVVVIHSKSKDIIQCGETNELGQFHLQLPKSSDLFYIFINSRVKNKIAQASIMNSPFRKELYFLHARTKALQSKNLGTYIATTEGKILGGAFHILDRIIDANQFINKEIRSKIKSDPSVLPTAFFEHLKKETNHCLQQEVIPKVEIYWQPGISTNQYLGRSLGCKSFYLINNQGRLFLCGGKDGDVDYMDTDHFDPSIIIHEYSHHINNFCSKIDAPGVQSHSGNSVIDPRLAFEEGWANFFQAAVLNEPYYTDTEGTIEGNTGFVVNIPIDEIPEICNEPGNKNLSGCDVPKNPGEGNFREFSITRFMWSVFSKPDQLQNGFLQFWSLLTSNFNYLSNEQAFRSVGLMHSLRSKTFQDSNDWQNLIESHKHIGSRKEFALRLYPSPYPCPLSFSIDPEQDEDASLLINNDFYHIKQEEDSNTTIQLNYKNQAGHEADLDLYIFKEFESLTNNDGLIGYSEQILDNQSETVQISPLKSGHYLINIKASTDGPEGHDPGGLTQYELLLNDKFLCTEEFIKDYEENETI